MKVYMNDRLVDKSDAKISVFDHGLLRGDGIFERLRFYQGNLFKLDAHLDRLFASAKGLMFTMPWSRDEMIEAIKKTCRANGLTSGQVALLVTRGVGSLDLSPKSCLQPQLVVIADKVAAPDKEFYDKGIRLLTSPQRQFCADVFPAQVKSFNYAKNVATKMEVERLGYDDAIILNSQGYITEAIVGNLFIVVKGELLTPPISAGALPGITRAAILELATALKIAHRETLLTRFDLWNADECFVTGSIVEIVSAVEADGRVIGTGKPGPVAARLARAFHLMAETEGVKFELEEAPVNQKILEKQKVHT